MRLPEFDLVSPTTVADACRELAAGSAAAQVIAGGTDLLVALKEGQKSPERLVDLAGVPGLDAIDFSPQEGLRVGALATLTQMARNPAIADYYPVLAETAGLVGTPQLQSMATVGGNICQDSCCMYFNRPEEVRRPLPPCHKLGGCICHVVPTSPACWAPYAGDMAPVLIALGASVTVAGESGERTLPLAGIFSDDGARPIGLETGEFITAVHCPPPAPHTGVTYLKLRPRETLDYAIAGVAASLTVDPSDGRCRAAAIVLTGVASAPKIVEETAELIGEPVTEKAMDHLADAAIKLSYPVKNVVGSEPGYRRAMVKVNVVHALQQSLRIAGNPEDGS